MIYQTYIPSFPTGSIASFAGVVTPSGWILCDGAAYDGTKEIYNPLWRVLQTTYGGSGQSSFRVPNLGARVPVGVKASTAGTGLDGPVGSWAGATDVTLTSSQTGLKSHNHGMSDPGHAHSFTNSFSGHTHQLYWQGVSFNTKNANTGYALPDGNNPNTTQTTSNSTSTSFNSGGLNGFSIGNNTAGTASSSHSNIQPQLVINYIIRL